jgi:DMSO reductase family type II enzyme heme b subunit
MEGPREKSVEDLLAEGPGTLTPTPSLSDGHGRRTDGGWEVVLVRPLPEGLGAGVTGQVAFAVWQGSSEESGSKKMRSVWIPLTLESSS